jgi:hypothetical protein
VLSNGYGQPRPAATTNHNLNLNLSNAIEITFTQGQSVGLTFTTATHYQNGLTSFNAATIRIRSNRRFNVTARSATTHFTSNSATPMPVSGILAVSINNSTTYRNLSASNTSLLTNQNRGVRSYTLSYRARPGFNYDAGTYTANIIYTATQL